MENQSQVVDNGGVELVLKVFQMHGDAGAAMLRPVIDVLWNLTFQLKDGGRSCPPGCLGPTQAYGKSGRSRWSMCSFAQPGC